ncbi:hypothetical protein X566_02620 [Afipia sp. P52-10]|uniref:hypothetical protein n=1 Tax=Afipia sp. P52-10 TaxID=1429916 RepID=UPI0003DF0FAB|nr:hypothetical protein [Afipia sp. P52-10]ETR78921.1 hypothetical protein X566_02620 [Afipia sp. P52-10]
MTFLAGVVFAVAAFAAWAGNNVHRSAVADRVCSSAGLLCDNPTWLFVAALLLGLVAIYRASVRP